MHTRASNHAVRGLGAMLAVLLSVAAVLPARAQSTEQISVAEEQVPLADARSRIDQVIETPAVMTAVMKYLSAEDQQTYLADVNKVISDMPASVEEKTAKFLNVDHAALKGAAKGNVATLIAEVYATVPPEALTVINERFAVDLLNRTADANVTYTDEEFTEIALEVMSKVNGRCEGLADGSPRCALAILMLVRASNGSPADLSEKLIDTLKDDVRELARNAWIPSALGTDDRQPSYESILVSADAGRRPDLDFVLVIAGPQYGDSVLQDILGKTSSTVISSSTTPVLDAVEKPHSETVVPHVNAGDDPADTVPYNGSAAYLALEAEMRQVYMSNLELFYRNREIHHPFDNRRMEWAEAYNWITEKKIDVSALATSRYKVSSLLLGSGVLADTNRFSIGNVSRGDRMSFKVMRDGDSVTTNSIVGMIEVCSDLGGAGPTWTSSVSATGLVSKAEIDAATGTITITPDNNATQLFIRVNVPHD